ncbi:class I SAM-dependent methyltransferase [Chitinophaga terrae (ex Kim and Jung 2007)]|nr:class I SAM-dependent methyltransferase [Chitinophaga terrae (ex Kim and Jung 2007)]MDQ0106633.1 ubiquinone/menaquinone biosynthesis C-methylase UbiE [Chitinophaga terrae (ex Kim and Jung 2007)]GEP89269.1 methyltransferase [Chitinophaga terrae (ex Kim and Jung 2007)]
MKNTERFTSRVENYVKYRPHYPVAVIPFLQEEIRLKKDSIIADIGAGTGISSQPFLDNGNKVYAVEPNKAMREMAVKLLGRFPNFEAVDGSAEDTKLPDASVDLIVVGTAFHWFDQPAATAEFRRIGKEDAWVVLMWNVRKSKLPFEKAYEDILHKYAINYKDMDHRNVGLEQLVDFFIPGTLVEKRFLNTQAFDFTALKGRMLSSSYVPEEGHPSYEPMIKALEDIFNKYQQNGMVTFHYDTALYLGRV